MTRYTTVLDTQRMKTSLIALLCILCIHSPSDAQSMGYSGAGGSSVADHQNSLGFTLLGGGAGILYRHSLASQHQLGLSLGYNPVFLIETIYYDLLSPHTYFDGVMIQPEFDFYLGSRTKNKQAYGTVQRQMVNQYLSVKLGYGISKGSYTRYRSEQPLTFSRYALTLSWHKQKFSNGSSNAQRGFDIGFLFRHMDLKNDGAYLYYIPVTLFIRWDWMWKL